MRTTLRRTAPRGPLESNDRFQSTKELHAAMSQQGKSLALSTVRRALQQFNESGNVDVFHSTDGETRYRRCNRTDQHGHLICRICGRTEDLGQTGSISGELSFSEIWD